ncbi:GAF and ANTAR domain-containing protein [Actinokineospora globicatena]|uniref:GAF and ANTAR domain-containing protein n=1 Tax=Actinokineospora globicatena TaxID=103729 RepID=UPI0020A3234A|nr:GAF and ANTAR domain-containing protein [Actinokineospora globicatena]MCP2303794.1 ANTAR domain-containing protein [Actinokineospora globicatena]GLW79054.1 GAF domain-containing protein [Actinokineospora globicatena]GLW86536.1 GAF domain-containing protein [Actinokineospora globicatena]
MVEDRVRRLRALVSAGRVDRDASVVGLVCELCVAELSISGAGATVLSHLPDDVGTALGRGLVYATDPVSAGLEDLQLTVNEGPCLDAFASGGPVLVADLAAEAARWPGFTPAACELGVAAVFSFPLQVGVVRLGSLDLHRDSVGPLSRVEMANALVLAGLATQEVVADLDGHDVADLSWLADPHVEIHQAAGMVQAQLGASTEVALLRLRAHAFTSGLPLAEVARQVVARALRFTDDGDRR